MEKKNKGQGKDRAIQTRDVKKFEIFENFEKNGEKQGVRCENASVALATEERFVHAAITTVH